LGLKSNGPVHPGISKHIDVTVMKLFGTCSHKCLFLLFIGLLLAKTGGAKDGPPPPPDHGLTPFTIRVFLEGFYDGDELMRRAKDHDGTDHIYRFTDPIAERITIELHTPGHYGEEGHTYAVNNVNLLNNGQATVDLPSEGTYYITIITRNHLETVSMDPIDFSATPREYDFTTAPDKAFGNNLTELEPTVYGLFAGDIDSNELINILDLNPIIESVRNNEQGYIIEDINGDGMLNILDINLVISNIRTNITAKIPD